MNINEYVLIGDKEDKYLSIINGHKYLRRLEPNCPMPEGYKSVTYLHHECVYTDDGTLKPKFQAVDLHLK